MIANPSFRQDTRTGAASPFRSALRDLLRDLLRRAAAGAPSGTPHAIPVHASLHLSAAPGARIDCLAGCVWVTVDGDPRDLIVEAGRSFTFDRSGRVLVHALEASRVRLADPSE